MMKNIEPELLDRLKLVEDPEYEGEPLNRNDYIKLFIACIVFPMLLMFWGWTL